MKPMSLIQAWLVSAAVFTGATIQTAQASYDYETVKMFVGETKIKVKSKVTYELGGWRHVEKLKIKIKNGYEKIKIKANGVDYWPTCSAYDCEVPVHATLARLEIMNLGASDVIFAAGECVRSALAYGGGYLVGGGGIFGSAPIAIVRDVERIVEQLDYYVPLEKQIQFTRPIKIAAGMAEAMTLGRGEYSMKTTDALVALVAQIDYAQAFVEETFKTDATFYLTVDLLASLHALADMLDMP